MCVRVCLQVVGLDADQRPLSRGDPAGEGQGSQPGSSEGPEVGPGAAEGLGRKLPGEWWWVDGSDVSVWWRGAGTTKDSHGLCPELYQEPVSSNKRSLFIGICYVGYT